MIHPQIWWGWRAVKSGEESAATLHTSKQLYISYLRYICEEWRVFLKVAFYPPLPESSIQSSQLRVQRYTIGGSFSKFSRLSHAHSAPFGKNPKGLWEKAWENRADFFSFTGKHLVIMMEKRKFADWLRNFVSQTIHDHQFPSPLYGR